MDKPRRRARSFTDVRGAVLPLYTRNGMSVESYAAEAAVWLDATKGEQMPVIRGTRC